MTNQITLEDFEQMLKQHDWTYMYSDDMRAWRKGKESESRIELAVKKDKTLNRFYKAYKHALDNRLERPTAKDFE